MGTKKKVEEPTDEPVARVVAMSDEIRREVHGNTGDVFCEHCQASIINEVPTYHVVDDHEHTFAHVRCEVLASFKQMTEAATALDDDDDGDRADDDDAAWDLSHDDVAFDAFANLCSLAVKVTRAKVKL